VIGGTLGTMLDFLQRLTAVLDQMPHTVRILLCCVLCVVLCACVCVCVFVFVFVFVTCTFVAMRLCWFTGHCPLLNTHHTFSP
jgi:hypothetical protein